MRNQASCECGWMGKHRWFRGSAVSDAYLHGAHTGHIPANTAIIVDGDTGVMLRDVS
jgi:hypothetical protein